MALIIFISAAMIADAIGDMPIANYPFVVGFTFFWAAIHDVVCVLKVARS